MRLFPFLSGLCCLFIPVLTFGVGNNSITVEAQIIQSDPSQEYYGDLSAPVIDEQGKVFWSERLLSGGSRLNSSGGVIATDPRTTITSGDFPIDTPTDALGGTVINQGANEVQMSGEGYLAAPAIFQYGQTKLVDFTSTFPGIKSDENLQADAGTLDDDGSVVFEAVRSQFFGAGAVNAICRLKGGSVTVLVKAGATVAPGGSDPFTYVVYATVSHGVITFYGETAKGRRGVFQLNGSTLSTVLDNRAKFPPAGDVASINSLSDLSFSSEGSDVAVAFTGGGVYKRINGKWSTVMKPQATIPDGTGIFYYAAAPALVGGRVAFVAGRNNQFAPPVQSGVYAEVANGFATVINESDTFNGQTGETFFPGHRWWDGSSVAVVANNGTSMTVCKVAVAEHPLTVGDGRYTIRKSSPNTLSVLDHATGPWGATLRISVVTQGSAGAVKIAGDQVVYTPGPDFAGADNFSYTVTDGTASATGQITVVNPFLALHGSFTQVVLGPDGAGAGLITATITTGGQLTGKVRSGGRTLVLKGAVTDAAEFGAYDSTTGLLDLQFAVVNNAPQVSGTLKKYPVSYTIPATRLSAAAAVAGVLPGSYTVRILPDGDAAHPHGYGWAHLSVNANGGVTLSGKLGDGTALSAGAQLQAGGTAPLFKSLYSKPVGSLAGVLAFADLAASDVTSTLTWVKPVQTPAGHLFPAGFQSTVTASGSRFHTTAGERSFTYTAPAQAQVKITDAAAAEST